MAAANSYGFDFLRAEHLGSAVANDRPTPHDENYYRDGDEGDGDDHDATTAFPPPLDVSHKSDLEKQADILVFLRHHRSSGCLPPDVIRKALGIDLSENNNNNNNSDDRAVAEMLRVNPKVKVEEIPDPENPSLVMCLYGYRAKFSEVRDRPTLLAQINRMKNGVRWNDLADAYDGVEGDLRRLLVGGEVLGVSNPEEKDRILFPRGESFLVELDGCVTVADEVAEAAAAASASASASAVTPAAAQPGGAIAAAHRHRDRARLVTTDVDPRTQIRRGEAIRVGGEWRRVSSEIRPDLPPPKQPPRAQAPPSVVSLRDLSRKNDVDGYCLTFDARTLPLDGPLGGRGGLANLARARAARERLRAVAGVGGAGTRGATAGGAAGAALLSSVATEKDPSVLAAHFAKSVATSFGMIGRGVGGGGGGADGGDGGGRRRPTARVGAMRRPGDVGAAGGGTSSAGMGGGGAAAGGKGRCAHDAEAVKAAVEGARRAASDPILSHSRAVRHGCTKDVREMYLETLSSMPASDVDLHRALIEHKLVDPGENMARQRMKRKNNVDNDGKPKKRRYYERKNMRRTNTHLDGTEIGAMLAVAAERQAHGKSVGDGGM
jgi:hypothetical protein